METTPAPAASESSSLGARYAAQIAGQFGCVDLGILAEPLRDALRDHAVKLTRETGLEVEFIQRKNFRKEARLAQLLARRGNHPGLVHIFSAMKPYSAFRPWHDKTSGRTGVKLTQGKCLHFFYYFVHERLGLCYLRVPTWLNQQLRQAEISCRMPPKAIACLHRLACCMGGCLISQARMMRTSEATV